MAIALNKHAPVCERKALEEGRINENSVSRTYLYEISRNWRILSEAATDNAKCKASADIIISTMVYLRRIGCYDIEGLLMKRIGGSKGD